MGAASESSHEKANMPISKHDTPDIRKFWKPSERSPLDPSPSAYLQQRNNSPLLVNTNRYKRPSLLPRPGPFGQPATPSTTSASPTLFSESSPTLFGESTPSSLKRIEERRATGLSTPEAGLRVPLSTSTPDFRPMSSVEPHARLSSRMSLRSLNSLPNVWEEEANKSDVASLHGKRPGLSSFVSKSKQKFKDSFKTKPQQDNHNSNANVYSLAPEEFHSRNSSTHIGTSEPTLPRFDSSNLDHSIASLATMTDPETMEYVSPPNERESPKDILERASNREATSEHVTQNSQDIYAHGRVSDHDKVLFNPDSLQHLAEASTEGILGNNIQTPPLSVSSAHAHVEPLPNSVRSPVTPPPSLPPQTAAEDDQNDTDMPSASTGKNKEGGQDDAVRTERKTKPTSEDTFSEQSDSQSNDTSPVYMTEKASSSLLATSTRGDGLVASECLAIIYFCTTTAAVYFWVEHVGDVTSVDELSLEMWGGWLLGLIICLVAHQYFGGRIDSIPQDFVRLVGRVVGNLIWACVEGYRRGRGE